MLIVRRGPKLCNAIKFVCFERLNSMLYMLMSLSKNEELANVQLVVILYWQTSCKLVRSRNWRQIHFSFCSHKKLHCLSFWIRSLNRTKTNWLEWNKNKFLNLPNKNYCLLNWFSVYYYFTRNTTSIRINEYREKFKSKLFHALSPLGEN